MKTAFLILFCKLVSFLGKLVGKGTSLPGKLVLKLSPNILKKIKFPEMVVAVTGSNGKTSTVEMIAHVLSDCGKKVAWNKEGSNQIEGVTTLILNNCDLKGRVKADVMVLESDEQYAKRTFSYFSPTHFAVTNLYRDQLTRNGHPEWVYEKINSAIPEGTKLILNADDPLVSMLGVGRKGTTYFSMDKNSLSTDRPTGVYNDGKYCPFCDEIMDYDYYHYSHIGRFSCKNCGFGNMNRDYVVTQVSLEEKYLVIDGKYRIDMAFSSIYNVYNICTAFAVCAVAGIDGESIANSLSNFIMKNGRIVRFEAGENTGVLITSKHENSISYNKSLEYVAARKSPTDVYIIIDEISRKYFTGETSWLWDIDFDILNVPSVEKIYICGRYAQDLAVRFSFTKIPPEKVEVMENLEDMGKKLNEKTDNEIYVVTCFSDKDKLLSRVRALSPVAK